MINNHLLASEAAKRLTERAGREITVDDLRQMRRRGHIQGETIAYNIVVYTPEQVDAATIPPERKPSKKKKKARKRTKSAST